MLFIYIKEVGAIKFRLKEQSIGLDELWFNVEKKFKSLFRKFDNKN